MARTYTEAVSSAILARIPVWNVAWEVALAKDETRHVTIDGFEFVLQADSRQTPTLNRGRVVSEDRVGRLYLPGWADPADPTIRTYIYVSTSLAQPSSEGLGAPKLVSRAEFDASVSHYYTKEGARGDSWLGNMHVLAIGDQSENVLISEFGRKGENNPMPLSIIIAIITYLLSSATGGKKNAARNAVLAGLGTYAYQSANGMPTGFEGLFGSEAKQLPEGTTLRQVKAPDGTPVFNDDGSPKMEAVDQSGTVVPTSPGMWSTLTSWGATGTAKVVGAASVGTAAATGKLEKYLPWLVGGVIVFALLRK